LSPLAAILRKPETIYANRRVMDLSQPLKLLQLSARVSAGLLVFRLVADCKKQSWVSRRWRGSLNEGLGKDWM
jgi:hypothetical protein